MVRILRTKLPCASRRVRVAQTVRPCTASQARRSIAAPLRAVPAPAAMLGTANGAPTDGSKAVHPWTALIQVNCHRTSGTHSELRAPTLLLLRQDAAQTGPHVTRRARGGKARRGARTMRARSSHVQGCTFDEPRNALADPEHRDVWRARHLGCVCLVTLHLKEKDEAKARRWIPAFAGMTSKETS